MNIEQLNNHALWMRRRILDLALKAGTSGAHLGGALSLVEIFATLYSVADISADDNRDRIILSKGHGALALYTALEKYGIIPSEVVDTFETNGTHLYAHASRDISKGIEFSGGSLGLGISFSVGVALACKEKGINNRIFVIVGDGECNEGLFWESIMTINQYKLNNMTIIIDNNGFQADGPTNDIIDLSPKVDKLVSFGFDAVAIDGHDVNAIYQTLKREKSDKPQAIVANTVKGKGVSFMESSAAWHHGVLNQKKYDKAIAELA